MTKTDEEIEKFLKGELCALIPDSGFIEEETGSDNESTINWIVDPIDGTTNYIYGYEYAVSVALQVNKQTEAGIVYVPDNGVIYYAQKGQGAYKVSVNGVNSSRLYMKDFDDNEGIIIFGVPYDRSKAQKIFKIVETIYRFASDIKRIGPASLDICKVAEGNAKLYVELDLKLWDIAAGELILNEAGGKILKKDDLFLCGSENCINMIMKDL